MANRWPDDEERPLGPIERRVLPWLAWIFSASLPAYMLAGFFTLVPGVTDQVAAVAGLVIAAPLAAWAIKPWSV
ncbi:hypothetical protein PMI01_03810 [Caulobacter sp. AP07]|uniref:hypothetical protein n=1 Tax=Caulobacter sp. AP07 TaxID=1144304 RepID=UPI0002720C54|nr:hypothetical protein [Caulobacter sp. AP07]EJL27329.1 hypothetical protein PMI01_03810 [Caulobacter sp. AP07]